MASKKLQKRIEDLFSDIDQLKARPESGLTEFHSELDALRARVAELESLVKESVVSTPEPDETPISFPELPEMPDLSEIQPPQTLPSVPILYEKEQLGYVFSDDRLEKAAPMLLKELDSERTLKAPLLESGQPIGAMLIERDEQGSWMPEDIGMAASVAQQVSLQIQNLRLLAAAERARADAQEATRRYTHESWESFMDAIHQSEQIAFAYDQSAVEPFDAPTFPDADFQETVSVLDEHVGRLFLKADPEHPLQESDRAFVAAVARQLGQQVENLRLLADASRARAEAEDATRRLTQQSWQEYMDRKEDKDGLAFVYDQNQVTVLEEVPLDIDFSQPLMVRGEPIGQLLVAGGRRITPEEADIVATIANQAGAHLEALRLTEELQKRAAELQELDRLKSSFLANMSHELRTPLNSILGFSDVMLEGIDGDLTNYMENDLKLIQKNGKHLLHLINDVLDMAKIESGRMNLHPERFKVHEIFDEVISITSSLANEKNLKLFVHEGSDESVEIFADSTRIKQVMINLVNNSIKFTEKGEIAISAKKLDVDTVLFTVKDTGLGVPVSHLETIFQEFAQVDTSTTRKVGGTGLGLPISRKLIEMHGGRMWAESTGISGEGTTLFVELPVEARIVETIEKRTK